MSNLNFAIAIVVQIFLVPVVIGAPLEPGRNVSKTVVGGSPARPGDFPYQVFIICGNSMCGGSIYDANTIITAAHCVFDQNQQRIPPRAFEIYAGSTEQRRGLRRFARYVKPHEDYNPNMQLNDIAIIGLSQPLAFGRTIQPIPLTPTGVTIQPGTQSVVSGFGSTTNTKGPTTNLRYATIEIREDSDCVHEDDPSERDPDSMICAGGDGAGACAGDSGGPLAVQIQGRRYLYGVVSFGPQECGRIGYPATYSKVSYFNSWVNQNS